MKAETIVNTLLEAGEEFTNPETEMKWLLSRPSREKRNWFRKLIHGDLRESQYIQDYLNHNGSVGDGNGVTIGSFLAYNLRGRAMDYMSRYAHALENACERRVECGLAFKGTSKLGRTAYYPVSQEEQEQIEREYR